MDAVSGIEPSREAGPPSSDRLSALAAALGVAAILLPVVGVTTRLVAFSFSGGIIDPSLAGAAPLSDLALLGLTATYPAAVLVAVYYVVLKSVESVFPRVAAVRSKADGAQLRVAAARDALNDVQRQADKGLSHLGDLRARLNAVRPADDNAPLDPELAAIGDEAVGLTASLDSELRVSAAAAKHAAETAEAALDESKAAMAELESNLPRLLRLVAWFERRTIRKALAALWLIGLTLAGVGQFLFFPGFPGLHLGIVNSVAAYIWFRRRLNSRSSPLGWWSLTPLVAFVLAFSAISYGLGPIHIGPVAVLTFPPGGVTATGQYAIPASDANFTYVAPCGSDRSVFGIPSSSILGLAFVRPERTPSVSLLGVLLQHQPLALGYWRGC